MSFLADRGRSRSNRAGILVSFMLAATGASAIAAPSDIQVGSGPAGTSWTRISGLPGGKTACAIGIGRRDGRFALLGQQADGFTIGGGTAWTSTNGSTWTRANVKNRDGSPIEDGAWAPRAMATWHDGFATIDTGVGFTIPRRPVLLSATGTTWKRVGWQAPTGVRLSDIEDTPSGLATIGTSRLDDKRFTWLFTSTDARTWIGGKVTGINGLALDLLIPSWGGFLIAGTSSNYAKALLWYSADGESWDRYAVPVTGENPYIAGITETPAGVVALHAESTGAGTTVSVLTSTDGIEWTKTHSDDLSDTLAPTALTWLGSELIAFRGDTVFTSPDAADWSSTTVAPFDGSSVAVAVRAGTKTWAAGCRSASPGEVGNVTLWRGS